VHTDSVLASLFSSLYIFCANRSSLVFESRGDYGNTGIFLLGSGLIALLISRLRFAVFRLIIATLFSLLSVFRDSRWMGEFFRDLIRRYYSGPSEREYVARISKIFYQTRVRFYCLANQDLIEESNIDIVEKDAKRDA